MKHFNKLIVAATALLLTHATAQLPNIVLINADDLGYGDLSCYGAEKISTPNIDSLAASGRRFTDAHSASAVCSPSRYGLFTGQYPLRKNFWGPAGLKAPLTIDLADLTISGVLKEAGYATACIGKWHLGFGEDGPDWNGDLKPGPLEVGFDHYYGIPTVNSGAPFVYVENHRVVGLDPTDPFKYGVESITKRMPEKSGYKGIGGAEAAHRLYIDEQVGTTLAGKAVDWIKQRDNQRPFFLYMATTNIHHPFTPAPQFEGTSECGPYGDFVHELDWMVGQVLEALDAIDATENTLVIFTSDNGGMLHVTGQNAWAAGHRLNGPLQGFKFGAWEGGHRIPFIARWPGKIPANSTSDALLSQIDLLATFAAIVDRPIEYDREIDSINQLETLIGEPDRPLRSTLIITPNSPMHLSIRHRDWVYIPKQGNGGFQGAAPGNHLLADFAALHFVGRSHSDAVNGKLRADAPPAQLYNLDADPYQTHNVYARHPEIVQRLENALDGYRAKIPESKRIGWINLRQPPVEK